jgi:hypothetical protein
VNRRFQSTKHPLLCCSIYIGTKIEKKRFSSRKVAEFDSIARILREFRLFRPQNEQIPRLTAAHFRLQIQANPISLPEINLHIFPNTGLFGFLPASLN